ncbi:HDOD domain-containing protein [Thiomonas sp.]
MVVKGQAPLGSPRGLAAWAEDLAKKDLPILGETVQKLLQATDDTARSMTEIGNIVLSDPALTSLVLRMANSSYFNAGRQKIDTITRALIVLGLDTVRTLCYSALVLESATSAKCRSRVVALLRDVLHAATQARFIAEKTRGSPERVFVAAMLQDIGQLSLWCFGGEQAEDLDRALARGEDQELAEQRIFGFRSKDLSLRMLDAWGLQDLAAEITVAHRPNAVALGRDTVAALKTRSPLAVERLVSRLTAVIKQSPGDLAAQMRENQKRALAMCPPGWILAGDAAETVDDPGLELCFDADAEVQLQALTDMHALPKAGIYLNVLINAAVEGILRGGGFDGTVFALRSADAPHFQGRIFTGQGPVVRADGFHTPYDEPLQRLLAAGDAVACTAVPKPAGGLQLEAGGRHALMGAVLLRERVIGLLYADRRASGRALGPAQISAFQLFVRQVNLVLQAYPA